MKYFSVLVILILFSLLSISIISCNKEETIDSLNSEETLNSSNSETDMQSSLIVIKNSTIVNTNVSPQDIQRTFSIVSGVFPYQSGGEFYSFFPGSADWVAGFSNELTKNDIPSMPSQILKRVNGKWVFFKTDNDAYFWGARNFKILGNHISIGDGNEIGPDGPGWGQIIKTDRNWNGDAYYGKIQNDGNILWKKVNDIVNRTYFHGTTLGDINGDGLLDVGGAPNAGTNHLKIFLQQPDGSFSVEDELITLHDQKQPFTLEFFDLDKDGIDEIITANYGGGDPRTDSSLNNIAVYKYDNESKSFKVLFKSDSPNSLYNIGMGATSIKCADLDNDGVYDISVAREDRDGHSFDIWKGLPNGTFVPHFASPVWTQNEIQFREFDLLDVNDDGFSDIILRPFAYGSLYRIAPGLPVPKSEGIKLNTIIQINDGTAKFNSYYKEELLVKGLFVQNLHPYMDGDVLHFIGTYTPDRSSNILETVDIEVRLKK